MQLASGRTIARRPLASGVQEVYATTGPEELTQAEWDEFCERVRERWLVRLERNDTAIEERRCGASPREAALNLLNRHFPDARLQDTGTPGIFQAIQDRTVGGRSRPHVFAQVSVQYVNSD